MIVEADLSAAELRVVAQLAQDGPWLRAFAAGSSPHLHTANLLFAGAIDKRSEEYVFAKSFNFRWVYSLPDKPASVDAGQLRTYRVKVDPLMLARATEQLNQAHPAIVAWKRQRVAHLHQTRRVTNAWGRYRDLSWALKAGTSEEGLKWREHAEAVALNFPVQGAIGEIMNDAFVQAWDALTELALGRAARTVWEGTGALRTYLGLGAPSIPRLIAQCHDALIAHCADAQVPVVADVLRRAIERPVPQLDGLLIPAEVKCGYTWGSVLPYEG